MSARPAAWLLPLAGAVCVAGAWPLSAHFVHPALLPALLASVACALLVAQRPEWGIAVAIALAPLTNVVVAGFKPLHFVLPALAGAVLVYGVLVRRRGRAPTIAPGVPFAVVLFCGAAAVSALFALDPAQSLTQLALVLTAALLFFAVLQVADSPERLQTIITGAVLALLIAALHGIAQQVLGQFGPSGGVVIDGEVVSRVQGSFGHPNQYGGFLAILIPLAVSVALARGLPGGLRLLAAVSALLAVQPLLFTFTRGAIVAAVVGSLLWLALQRPRAAFGAAVAIAVLAFAFAPAALRERLQDDRTGGDIGLRADLWRSALEIYGTSPIVGVGLDNFGVAYAQLPSSIAAGVQRRLLHNEELLVPPHANNLTLTVLAEQGLIGLIALACLVFSALLLARRLSQATEPIARALSVGVGAGLLVMAAHSLLEVTLFSEAAFALFALLGAATVAAVVTVPSAAAVAHPKMSEAPTRWPAAAPAGTRGHGLAP